MRACSTAGGGVMFIADDVQRKAAQKKNTPISYKELLQQSMEADAAKAGAGIILQDNEGKMTALQRLEKFARKIAAMKLAQENSQRAA